LLCLPSLAELLPVNTSGEQLDLMRLSFEECKHLRVLLSAFSLLLLQQAPAHHGV